MGSFPQPYYRQDTGQRITISELLGHTSDIPNFTDTPGFLDGPASRAHYGVRDFVQRYCSGDLHFTPGSKFRYSNSGYFLLGAILGQVSGQSYESLLQERIVGPLGMKDSGDTHSEAINAHGASGHERTRPACKTLATATCLFLTLPARSTRRIGDLYLWDQALDGERRLPAKLRELLFTPNLDNDGDGCRLLIPSTGSPYAGESIPTHGGATFWISVGDREDYSAQGVDCPSRQHRES
ncbi:MAG TPA: serine hydrolase [Candidatus Sulfotelmatobacter sp.]